jgi:hypothetical protein
MICQICQAECNGPKGLGLHINKTHNLSPKEYYDKYLRKPDEGMCGCGKEVPFGSLGRGYEGKHCSQQCMLNIFQAKRITDERIRAGQIPVESRVVCQICDRQWGGLSSLGVHITRTHQMSTKDYYDKYLKKDSKEGVCLECGKPTFFQDMGAGYPNKYCSMSCNKAESKRAHSRELQEERDKRKADVQTCRICGQRVIGFKGLSNHVNQKHATSSQQYYDAYLAKLKEGLCQRCGKPTRFESLNKGYFDYCSIQCNNQSEKFKAMMSKVSSRVPGRLKGRPSPRKGTELPFDHVKNIRLAAIKRAEEHCLKYGHEFPTRGNAEVLFMEVLQHCSPHKIDFNFRPCGYIVDGYIHELKLVVEFDEVYHDSAEQQAKDRLRENNIRCEVPNIRFFRVREADWSADPQHVINDFGNVVYP